ncbi:MAG: hypothetical protein V3V47_07960 [Desulfobacteria bacterium]
MNQTIIHAYMTLFACIVSACFTIYVVRRSNKMASEIVQEHTLSIREEVQALLDTEFAAFRPLISRAMTLAGNAGNQAKKVQAFEREAIRAVQDDLPITPDMIRSFSPKLGDMIDENPELLFKGREILQKILGDQQGSVRARIDRRAEI